MKILIVEDELKTLNHICQAIENLPGDFCLAGTARNGKDGVAKALELKPDLIITDIKMPIMTGLEMIQQLVLQEAEFFFIVLSGYSDFSFAREAIKLGSIDYLLKPFTKEEFADALHKAAQKIHLKMSARDSFPGSLTNAELFQNVFELAEGGSAQYQQCTREFETRFAGRSLGLLLVKSDHSITSKQQDLFIKILGDCANAHQLDEPVVYARNASELLVLYVSPAIPANFGKYDFMPALKNFRHRLDHHLTLPLAFFWQEIRSSDPLDIVLDTMNNQIQFNISLVNPVILTEDYINRLKPAVLVYPKQLEKAVIQALLQNSEEELIRTIDEFCQYLTRQLYSPIDIRLSLLQFTEAVMFVIREKNYGIYQNLSLLEILNWIKSRLFLFSFQDVILNVCRQVIQFNTRLSACDNPIVNRVLQIIAGEYSSPISLEQIAKRCNVTYEYLSSLFSKELGIKFTAYLTQYRMNQAQAFLLEGSRIAEVAAACGYEDTRYFNRVFKNHTGMSPSEFVRQVNR